jgi:hypothetical protein
VCVCRAGEGDAKCCLNSAHIRAFFLGCSAEKYTWDFPSTIPVFLPLSKRCRTRTHRISSYRLLSPRKEKKRASAERSLTFTCVHCGFHSGAERVLGSGVANLKTITSLRSLLDFLFLLLVFVLAITCVASCYYALLMCFRFICRYDVSACRCLTNCVLGIQLDSFLFRFFFSSLRFYTPSYHPWIFGFLLSFALLTS